MTPYQSEIQKIKGEIKGLKKGVSFWASKVTNIKIPKRVPIKVNFKYKDKFYRDKKIELRGKIQGMQLAHKLDLQMFEELINKIPYSLKGRNNRHYVLEELKQKLEELK